MLNLENEISDMTSFHSNKNISKTPNPTGRHTTKALDKVGDFSDSAAKKLTFSDDEYNSEEERFEAEIKRMQTMNKKFKPKKNQDYLKDLDDNLTPFTQFDLNDTVYDADSFYVAHKKKKKPRVKKPKKMSIQKPVDMGNFSNI
mmetsp:Transcript_12635/g.11183  ORF Transcript_12635/g.11183 Transcript_12635/m.11183 type:complete len:144 (+) Transcript_12635:318-749(+)